jgi:LysR family transcriptional regulator, hypochlorite-specific transcription factor HypT
MDLAWIEDFLKLAEEGNFSRAAEARNLSQPAFSRRIKGLEEWVGVTLIDRETHRIVLTEAGAAFRVVTEDVLRRLALGRDEAREIGASQTRMIRFAATQALAVTFFPTWLHSFEEQEEFGTISLIADTMAACERLMLEGRADFLLCHEHPAAPNRLDEGLFRSLPVGEDRLVPVCVADDGQARFALPGDPTAPLPYLAFDERSGMGRILDAAGVIAGGHAALRTVFRSHLASGLLHMARNGMGVAWAPFSLCRGDLEAGSLVRAGDAYWEVPVEIRLFRPKARRNAIVEGFWRRVSSVAHPNPVS